MAGSCLKGYLPFFLNIMGIKSKELQIKMKEDQLGEPKSKLILIHQF